MHQAFKYVAENPTADLFKAIRKKLFKNFEVQAGFHQELQAAYEGECDAPDPQQALVWKKQQRKSASHVPSAYLIWTRGKTAQSAIASLADQILVQKTEVMIDAGIDLDQFKEANNNVESLWKFFTYLTTVLGGCMIYITIWSVEINSERKISDTIRSLLWEMVWREVRYAVIGIALTQVIDKIHIAAKRAARETTERNQSPFSEADIKRMREQIQRHIDIVDIHLPPDRKKRLECKLTLLVFEQDEKLGLQLTFAQREAI
ncbi:hypothetical protein CaCOL14_003631 [Colletotrichum acutatum]